MQGFDGVRAVVFLPWLGIARQDRSPAPLGPHHSEGRGSPSAPRPAGRRSERRGEPGRLREAQAMSNVRISNGSPTLERMEARQADYPKPSACRNLFGPVDHDVLARELRRHRDELEEASRRQWNFDFQRHQPLVGRYEWHAVGSDALPDFYSRPPRLSRARQQKRSGGWDVKGNCPAGARGRSQGLDGEADEEDATPKTDPAAQTAAQRKRPASDDSSPRNKRANTTDEAVSEDSPSASSVEQTPKKSSPRRDQT